jgi:hypothetical protein
MGNDQDMDMFGATSLVALAFLGDGQVFASARCTLLDGRREQAFKLEPNANHGV